MKKPLDVECPRCGASRGKPCKTADRVVREPHRRRVKASAHKG
ncbi:zinc finger domain-containing protein [Cellulomonas sp. P5_E12]